MLLGSGLFGDEDTQAEVDAAFEAFKLVCERDGSPVGLALRERYEVVLPDFAKLWRSYDEARKAEKQAARAHVKPEFVVLGAQIDWLRSALSSLDGNLKLRRYVTDGLQRQIGRPAQASRQEAKALLERVAGDLRCIDPKLTRSQVKTALQKLSPLAKVAKNQN